MHLLFVINLKKVIKMHNDLVTEVLYNVNYNQIKMNTSIFDIQGISN